MNAQVPSEEQKFLKDVANHVMTIVRDDGVHRHLRFAKPGTYCMSFDIVTYPGHLVYSGDMGCYVFSRLHDMFEFFRVRPRDEEPGRLHINLSYWAEKLEATDKPDGHKQYDEDKARERVTEWLAEKADELAPGAHARLSERVEDELLSYVDEGEYAFREALRSFEDNGRYPFQDSWEWSFDEYTFRFVWCCYALAWSIQQYDAAKAKAAA
jgi:hypothetical protein